MILNMISFKKLADPVFFAIVFCWVFFRPDVAAGKVFDRVVAKVNSEIVTLSSIEERVVVLKQKYRNELAKLDEKKILSEALEMIIAEKLQLQQARKMGFEVDDSAVEAAIKDIENKNGLQEGQLAQMLEAEGNSLESYKNRIRDQIIVSKITKFELGSRLQVSERKIARYYHDHQKEFWEPGRARVRHILILSEEGATAKKKKEKFAETKKILSEIRKGKDFAEAAKEYSEDISASSGGDVGFVEKGKMVPEFEKAVYRLKAGEISDIVETEYGFHIIKVEEIQKGRTLPLDKVKGKIQFILAGKKQKAVYESWMKELKDSAFIEISLFKEPKRNLSSSLFDSKKNREDKPGSSRKTQKKNKGRLVDRAKKRKMQDRWEEMYKSVEKSKKQNPDQTPSSLQDMEEKLKAIKDLRSQGKITESQYQRRKQKLLDDL